MDDRGTGNNVLISFNYMEAALLNEVWHAELAVQRKPTQAVLDEAHAIARSSGTRAANEFLKRQQTAPKSRTAYVRELALHRLNERCKELNIAATKDSSVAAAPVARKKRFDFGENLVFKHVLPKPPRKKKEK